MTVLRLYVHNTERPCSTDVEVSSACNLYFAYITVKINHLSKLCQMLSVHPTGLHTQYFLLLHYDRWFLLTGGLTSYWSHRFGLHLAKDLCSYHLLKTGSKVIPLWLSLTSLFFPSPLYRGICIPFLKWYGTNTWHVIELKIIVIRIIVSVRLCLICCAVTPSQPVAFLYFSFLDVFTICEVEKGISNISDCHARLQLSILRITSSTCCMNSTS